MYDHRAFSTTHRLRAFDTQIHFEAFHVEARVACSLSLSSIIVGLAGAAAIVYVATRHGHPPAVPGVSGAGHDRDRRVSLVR